MELKGGERIKLVVFPDDSLIKAGRHGVASLEVVMQHGQMDWVPWVKETRDDGATVLHNCAHIASIELAED